MQPAHAEGRRRAALSLGDARRALGSAIRAGRRAGRIALRATLWLLVAALASLCLFEAAVRLGSFDTSDLQSGAGDSIRILDADGGLLREAVNADGARAEWRDLDEISPLLVAATIAVEDQRFFSHSGVDAVGLMRAAWDNVRHVSVVSGASTLTMQLSRLLHPHRRSVWGKLVEMVRARRMERALDKQTILEQYLNRAPYGAGAIGVEAASRRYFGKPNTHLSLAEAALIAGLPNAPTRLNPFRNPQAARARQHKVLARMLETGAIEPDEFRRALRQPLRLRTGHRQPFAMHFTDFALAEARPTGGDFETTLDRGLEKGVEGLVADHVESLALGGLSNAAVVVLDNERCEIRAMVGSADYWDEQSGAVNGALAPRQPGSALKPFTYALAFERGYTPASVVADIETRYGGPDGEEFSPRNFSGTFSGPVMMGDALGRSLNVPAIRVANLVGPHALLDKLRALGISTLTKSADYYGLGLTLGNGEVSLLELTAAYAALARGGLSCRARATPGGQAHAERVFSPEIAYLVTDVLSDERLRIAAFGPANALLLGFPVAVKTGTSSNWRDSWAIGYTSRYTVGVWSGDFEGRSMNHLAGATGAGPLFHNVMSLVVERDHGHSPEAPNPPPGVVAVNVCPLSGLRPSEHCPHHRTVHMLAEDVPTETCTWHEPVLVDVRNGLRAGEHCPEEHTTTLVYERLPPDYATWQAESGEDLAPIAYSPHCPASGPVPGAVVITYPRDGEVFLIEPGYDRATQTLELAADAEALIERVSWSVDGRSVGRSAWPYSTSWRLEPGLHVARASAPGQRDDTVSFEVR